MTNRDFEQQPRAARMRRAAGLAALALALAVGLSAPARALDDGDESAFDTLKGLFSMGTGLIGVGGGDDAPRIDYRERAPLVLPPSNDLRPPIPGVGERNAAWPKDYDRERARRAAERARRPSQNGIDGYGGMSPDEIRRVDPRFREGQRDLAAEQCPTGPLDRICDPNSFWSTMKNTRSAGGNDDNIVAGVEPPRARLTDPPSGYRKATKTTKYTFDAREPVDYRDPRAQIREDARRAREGN